MRYRAAINLVIAMAILPGCWGSVELKDVGIVSGVGIDTGEDSGLELTTQTIMPGNKKGSSPNSVSVQSSSGTTVFEAVRNLIITAKKKQNFQHIDVLVIGEQAAKNGVTPLLDFFIRDHEPRFGMHIFMSEDKAKDLLEIENKDFPIPVLAMKSSLEEQKSLSKAPKVELHDFFQRFADPYRDPYLPIIHKNKKNFEIHGTAIFNGDKLVGELTALETRGMLRALGETKGGIQVIKLPSSNEEPVYISIEIKKSESSLSTSIKNGQPVMSIEIKERGFIGDVSQEIVLNEKKMEEIKQLYTDAIEKEVNQAVSKIQKDFQANIFDFAGTIKRTDKQYWKQQRGEWEEIYPTIKVEVTAKTDIPANGLIDSEGRK